MTRNGQILLIDDDSDDLESFEESFLRLGIANERIYFTNADELLKHLKTTKDKPLAIISDYRLSPVNGFDLKGIIAQDETLRRMSIPFIFFTGSASPRDVNEAFEKHVVQGFFTKPNSIGALDHILQTLVTYWQLCEHPNVKAT